MTEIMKPWGKYEDVVRTKNHVVKYITVEPGHSLSFQRHKNREEFWLIVAGPAMVQLGNVETEMRQGQTVHIYRKEKHRLSNNGSKQVVVLELQYGDCDEDDIERLSDNYGRG